MVGVDGCRKIVPGCKQERKPNSGMAVNVYSTANVLFGKHLSYIETVLVLSKGNKINRRMSGTLKNDILKWRHLCATVTLNYNGSSLTLVYTNANH